MKAVIILSVLILSPVFLPENPSNSETQVESSPSDARPKYVGGEILVKYKSHIAPSTIRAHEDRLGGSTRRSIRKIGVNQVKLPATMTTEAALEFYKNNPDVEYAEPNYIRWTTATTPNDPSFSNLWALRNTGQTVNGVSGTTAADMEATEAWDLSTGSSTIVIAVIDSGVDYNHPDLSPNIWVNPGEIAGNGIDDDGNGYVDDVYGWDFADDDNNSMDVHGHGTHVSGTIAAVGNNHTGISGVCWQAKIMPIRALNAFGSGTDADIVAAIEYAVHQGAKVINASFGGLDYGRAMHDAIALANFAGVLFVAAAGNNGSNNDSTPFYPASYNLPNIISVAASDQDDHLTDFSNYGVTSVHVAAPGQNIYSTVPAARMTIWSDNFDGGKISYWITGGRYNTWGLSARKTYNNSPYSLTDTPSGNYQNHTASWARAPVLNLSAYAGTKLAFQFTGKSLRTDRLYVQTSTNGTLWINQDIYIPDLHGSLPSLYGDVSDRWYRGEVDLGKYDGKSAVYVRFYFSSSSSGTSDGWYVDDVSVTAASSSYAGTEYKYWRGTSMAAPHVAGLAGLVWSQYPSLSMSHVRETIINSVDKKSSFAGKVASGGRVNARKPFLCFGTVDTPTSLTAEMAAGGGIHLTWLDNSSYEIGVKIERKQGADGTFTQIATVATQVTSYTDTEAIPGEEYSYRVQSYNCTAHSDYSNEATVATPYTQSVGSSNSGGSSRGGCFIATAAFGSRLAPQVVILRQFRDTVLIKSAIGRSFIRAYNRYSPPLAKIVGEHETLRGIIRLGLLPLVAYGYCTLLIGHGITFTLFSGIFLTLISFGFTKIRKSRAGGDLPRN